MFSGSLSYAALDSVPHDLVDNAAIVGTVSLVTAGLFLLDMGGPKAKRLQKEPVQIKKGPKTSEAKNMPHKGNDIEKQIEQSERKHSDLFEKPRKDINGVNNGMKNNNAKEKHGLNENNHAFMQMETPRAPKGIFTTSMLANEMFIIFWINNKFFYLSGVHVT